MDKPKWKVRRTTSGRRRMMRRMPGGTPGLAGNEVRCLLGATTCSQGEGRMSTKISGVPCVLPGQCTERSAFCRIRDFSTLLNQSSVISGQHRSFGSEMTPMTLWRMFEPIARSNRPVMKYMNTARVEGGAQLIVNQKIHQDALHDFVISAEVIRCSRQFD